MSIFNKNFNQVYQWGKNFLWSKKKRKRYISRISKYFKNMTIINFLNFPIMNIPIFYNRNRSFYLLYLY